jgi:hypothetical protein
MGLVWLTLLDKCDHRPARRLGPTNGDVGDHGAHGFCNQLDGRIRVDRPVRNEQRAGAGVEEGSRHAGKRLDTFGSTRCCVAGRQDYPVSIDLESGNLGS